MHACVNSLFTSVCNTPLRGYDYHLAEAFMNLISRCRCAEHITGSDTAQAELAFQRLPACVQIACVLNRCALTNINSLSGPHRVLQ